MQGFTRTADATGGWPIPGFRFLGFNRRLAPVDGPTMSSFPPPISSTDADVFARIQSGDTAAFAEFYDRHSSLFFGIALKVLGNSHDAEDVLQEAAVLIWERAPLYDAALGQPVSWAVALTRNKAIDRLRSVRRRTEVMDAAAQEPAASSAPEVPPARRAIELETGEFVNRALEALSPDQRHAIELAFYGGLTQQEIALRLDQPLGTIKARIRRGMLALRDLLEGQL